MQKRHTIWYFLITGASVSLLLLSTGAVLAIKGSMQSDKLSQADAKISDPQRKSQTSQSPVALPATAKGSYKIVALGDSLTRGTGDENGQGYVGYLASQLQTVKGSKVTTNNLGINGLKAPELLQYIQSPDVKNEIASAQLITLSIGGNDLVQGVGNVTTPDLQKAAKTRESYTAELDQIMQELRKQNNNAPILFIGLYNPFLLTQEEQQRKALDILNDWNEETNRVLLKYPNTLVVPTEDLFAVNRDKFLADDLFHPNAQGYQAIAERILHDIK